MRTVGWRNWRDGKNKLECGDAKFGLLEGNVFVRGSSLGDDLEDYTKSALDSGLTIPCLLETRYGVETESEAREKRIGAAEERRGLENGPVQWKYDA